MGVEKRIDNTFEQYKKDDKALEERIVEQFKLKMKWVASSVWFAHFAVIVYGFLKLVSFLAVVDPTKAAPALTAVFGGGGVLCWIVFGTYFWFADTYDHDPWVGAIADVMTSGYARSREIKRLKAEQGKRNEFFNFYELYQNDEVFRESYLSQVSKKAESDEFLAKLNKINET